MGAAFLHGCSEGDTAFVMCAAAALANKTLADGCDGCTEGQTPNDCIKKGSCDDAKCLDNNMKPFLEECCKSVNGKNRDGTAELGAADKAYEECIENWDNFTKANEGKCATPTLVASGAEIKWSVLTGAALLGAFIGAVVVTYTHRRGN